MERLVSLPGRASGVLAPLAVAALLVPVRESLEPTTLVLVFVVVVVAVATSGDRVAAVMAAGISAASFDFFLTKPYLSLRITSASDIETAAMLGVIGLIVGQLAAIGHSRAIADAESRHELAVIEAVVARFAEGIGPAAAIDEVRERLALLLDLESCTFTETQPELVEVRSDGRIEVHRRTLMGGEFALPAEGVALRVVNRQTTYGWLMLVPAGSRGVSLAARKVAVALATLLGGVLGRREGAR